MNYSAASLRFRQTCTFLRVAFLKQAGKGFHVSLYFITTFTSALPSQSSSCYSYNIEHCELCLHTVLNDPLADPVSILIEEKVKASLQAEGGACSFKVLFLAWLLPFAVA